MVEFKRALFVLASPAEVQESLYPSQVAIGDEIVNDFGFALDDLNTAEFTPRGQESLKALDQYIIEHSGKRYADHYLDNDKLQTSTIWVNIRELANKAIDESGFSTDKPEELQPKGIYVVGNRT